MPPERTYGGENFLPNLEILELNHCPLHRALIDLLVPLRNSRIAVLQATASGLTGSLPDFKSFIHPQIKRRLVAMELAWNDISSIDAIPPNCRTLNLANNHRKIRFNDGVLRQALKDGVRIDVRNMTLANQSDTLTKYVCGQNLSLLLVLQFFFKYFEMLCTFEASGRGTQRAFGSKRYPENPAENHGESGSWF